MLLPQVLESQYTKTKPMEDADLAGCLAWWHERSEGPHAWRVSVGDVLNYDADGRLVSANLDVKNPHSLESLEHREAEDLIVDILEKERRVMRILEEVESLIRTESFRCR